MYRVVFDPLQPKADEIVVASGTTDWKEFYGYIKEDIPLGIIEPLGKSAHTTSFVDANYACNVVNWRFHTRVLIYVVNAPITF